MFLWISVPGAMFARESSHGLSYFGDLKCPKDSAHYTYANADAPKGGKMRTSIIGTFNNLHPYVSKGISAAGNTTYNRIQEGDST